MTWVEPTPAEMVRGMLAEVRTGLDHVQSAKTGMQAPYHGTYASLPRAPGSVRMLRTLERDLTQVLERLEATQ